MTTTVADYVGRLYEEIMPTSVPLLLHEVEALGREAANSTHAWHSSRTRRIAADGLGRLCEAQSAYSTIAAAITAKSGDTFAADCLLDVASQYHDLYVHAAQLLPEQVAGTTITRLTNEQVASVSDALKFLWGYAISPHRGIRQNDFAGFCQQQVAFHTGLLYIANDRGFGLVAQRFADIREAYKSLGRRIGEISGSPSAAGPRTQ